jgi:hypothetical protein
MILPFRELPKKRTSSIDYLEFCPHDLMADVPCCNSRVLDQPPSIEFIENRLARLHPEFGGFPLRYDKIQKRFVPDYKAVVMSQRTGLPGDHSRTHGTKTSNLSLDDRVLPPPVYAMKFWALLLEKSMEKLKVNCPQEPERLQKRQEYSIRTQRTWKDVYGRLQLARTQYDGSKSGLLGRMQRTYRKLADQSATLDQTLGMAPDIEYISPVKATVQVLLEVGHLGRMLLELC